MATETKKFVERMLVTGGWAGEETHIELVDGEYVTVDGDLAFTTLEDITEFKSLVVDLMQGLP